MNDIELTRALERSEVPNDGFHHASHLRVAWVYLRESSSPAAADKMCATLRRFAASVGQPEKYHQTITVFWMRILASYGNPAAGDDIEAVLDRNPQLLDKDFPLKFYSRPLLFGDRARTDWVEPDLKPLPLHATAIRASNSPRDSSHRVVYR